MHEQFQVGYFCQQTVLRVCIAMHGDRLTHDVLHDEY